MLAPRSLHGEAASHASTRWAQIATAYTKLESVTGNPKVRRNRAVAIAMVEGPAAGLALLEGLELRDSHRPHAVRAHLLERIGDVAGAAQHCAAAAARTGNDASATTSSNRRPASAPAETSCRAHVVLLQGAATSSAPAAAAVAQRQCHSLSDAVLAAVRRAAS